MLAQACRPVSRASSSSASAGPSMTPAMASRASISDSRRQGPRTKPLTASGRCSVRSSVAAPSRCTPPGSRPSRRRLWASSGMHLMRRSRGDSLLGPETSNVDWRRYTGAGRGSSANDSSDGQVTRIECRLSVRRHSGGRPQGGLIGGPVGVHGRDRRAKRRADVGGGGRLATRTTASRPIEGKALSSGWGITHCGGMECERTSGAVGVDSAPLCGDVGRTASGTSCRHPRHARVPWPRATSRRSVLRTVYMRGPSPSHLTIERLHGADEVRRDLGLSRRKRLTRRRVVTVPVCPVRTQFPETKSMSRKADVLGSASVVLRL